MGGNMPGKRYTNKDIIERLDELNRNTKKEIIEKLERLEQDSKKSHGLSLVAIGVAFIAMTVPLILNYTNVPLWGQIIVIFIYFSFGLGIIISGSEKMKNKNDKV